MRHHDGGGGGSIRMPPWRDDFPGDHWHHARLWQKPLRGGPQMTSRTSPEGLISGVPAGAATEVAARGLGGLLGKSLIAVKNLTGDALLTIARDQG